MLGVTAIAPGGDCKTTEFELTESGIRLADAPEPCITGTPCGDDCGSWRKFVVVLFPGQDCLPGFIFEPLGAMPLFEPFRPVAFGTPPLDILLRL